MLILETPFWVAGAAESMKIGRIVIGASNKSGRRHVGSLAGSSRPLVPFSRSLADPPPGQTCKVSIAFSAGRVGTWRVGAEPEGLLD